MNTEIKARLEDLLNSIKIIKIDIINDPYPPVYESTIQDAVACKRNGNYDKSVEIYLGIFKNMGCVNANIAAFLYKTLVSAEEFYLAFMLISFVEVSVILTDGPKMPIAPFPGGPVIGYIKWAFTEYREELKAACKNTLFYRDPNYLLNYVKPLSGNPLYRFKKSNNQIFEEIKEIFK